jgi:hypothetical protein
MRLFRLRDSAERIARGFALGLIVNFFPTLGLGWLASGFLARLLGGNMVAGFVGGAALAFFWPLLFYMNMITGGWVTGRYPIRDPEEVTEERITALLWGQTFTTGAVLNAACVGLAVYFLLYWAFDRYRSHGLSRLYRAMKTHQRRVARKLGSMGVE